MPAHRIHVAILVALLVTGCPAAESPGILAGETYRLTAKCSGKALAVAGASTLDNAEIHQWTADGGPAQQWRIDALADGYRLTAICSGKALQVEEARAGGGAIAQAVASGTARQVWRIVDAGGGWFKLVNQASGTCLDVAGAGTADGTRVQHWPDNGAAAQRWRLDAVTTAPDLRSVVTPGTYRLTARHSGLALEVAGGSGTPGADVRQYTDNGSDAQRWRIAAARDGGYQLTCKASTQVLEVAGASLADGADIQQGLPDGGAHQRWTFQHVGGDWFRVAATHSGKLMDVAGASTAVAAEVLQWHANGGTNQLWKLTPDYRIPFARGDSRFVVARGDLVTVTAQVTGVASVYEACGLGRLPDFPVTSGGSFRLRTDIAGRYTYAIRSPAGVELAGIEVVVVAVGLSDLPIADQYGYTRRVVVTVVPDSAPILFSTSDPAALSVGAATFTPGHATFLATALKPGAAEVLAIIPGPAGPCVISRRTVDGFALSTTASTLVKLIGQTPDGGPIVSARLTMTPLITGLDLRLQAFVSGITFSDSTTTLLVPSSQLTRSGTNGTYDYALVRTPTGMANFCHTMTAFQGAEQVSR